MDVNFTYGRSNISLGLIIEQLEAHWAVLEAELIEISKDLKRLNDMKLKYGEPCNQLVDHLTQLKQERKTQLRQIQETMQKFDFDASKGQKLLVDLESSRL